MSCSERNSVHRQPGSAHGLSHSQGATSPPGPKARTQPRALAPTTSASGSAPAARPWIIRRPRRRGGSTSELRHSSRALSESTTSAAREASWLRPRPALPVALLTKTAWWPQARARQNVVTPGRSRSGSKSGPGGGGGGCLPAELARGLGGVGDGPAEHGRGRTQAIPGDVADGEEARRARIRCRGRVDAGGARPRVSRARGPHASPASPPTSTAAACCLSAGRPSRGRRAQKRAVLADQTRSVDPPGAAFRYRLRRPGSPSAGRRTPDRVCSPAPGQRSSGPASSGWGRHRSRRPRRRQIFRPSIPRGPGAAGSAELPGFEVTVGLPTMHPLRTAASWLLLLGFPGTAHPDRGRRRRRRGRPRLPRPRREGARAAGCSKRCGSPAAGVVSLRDHVVPRLY